MIKFLIKKFVKNYEEVTNKEVREAYGVFGGTLGVLCNMTLFSVKIIIGMVMNSIAIVSDAFNNLSDMGSSLVAIIGSKMSNRNADKEHPFGHGRIEYVASLIVSFAIIMVGIELFKTSFAKILNPNRVEFSWILIIILSLSVLIKLFMFSYNKYIAKAINSSIMDTTAHDSLNDVFTTGGVIIATIAGKYTTLPIDGIAGILVSSFITYTGIGIAKNIISLIIGVPPSEEMVNNITAMVLSGEGIVGVHDLIIHDYGPGRTIASVHAEVPDDINIVKVHEIIDMIEQKVNTELDITLVIHMDPISVNCEKTDKIKQLILDIVIETNPEFSIHDFRMTDGENNINLIFDLVVPIEMKMEERKNIVEHISKKLSEADSKYKAVIQVDNAY